MPLTTADIPLTHPRLYEIRSDLIRLVNRVESSGDTDQKTFILSYLSIIQAWITLNADWIPSALNPDPLGHKSRGLNRLAYNMWSTSRDIPAVKTDALAMLGTVSAFLNAL